LNGTGIKELFEDVAKDIMINKFSDSSTKENENNNITLNKNDNNNNKDKKRNKCC
jgi:hypothetical protein